MQLFHDFFAFFFPAFLGLAMADPGAGGAPAAPAAGTPAGGDPGPAGGIPAGGGAPAAPAAPPVAAGPLLGADGKFLPGWAKQLGGSEALEAKFTDPKALVGSYQSLEKLISAKGIIPPGP